MRLVSLRCRTDGRRMMSYFRVPHDTDKKKSAITAVTTNPPRIVPPKKVSCQFGLLSICSPA